jgi:hypothetical protein
MLISFAPISSAVRVRQSLTLPIQGRVRFHRAHFRATRGEQSEFHELVVRGRCSFHSRRFHRQSGFDRVSPYRSKVGRDSIEPIFEQREASRASFMNRSQGRGVWWELVRVRRSLTLPGGFGQGSTESHPTVSELRKNRS